MIRLLSVTPRSLRVIIALCALALFRAQELRAQDLRSEDVGPESTRSQNLDGGNYPNKPIHIVVPFPADGPTDLLARVIGKEMTASWGRAVVIDNRPGADTAIGAEMVAKANPDGYTLLAGLDSTMVLNPLLMKNLPYDASKDFEPISLLARNVPLLEVRSDSSVRSVRDLIDALKAKPGKLNLGVGTSNSRLAALLLARQTGTTFTIVPYIGGMETVDGLLNGSIDVAIAGAPSSLPLITAGKLRPLAKFSDLPLSKLQQLPLAAAAAGAPALGGYSIWVGLYAPAGTSREITGKLEHFIATIYADPTVAKRLDDAGIIAVSSTPAELVALAGSDAKRWDKIIRDNGISNLE